MSSVLRQTLLCNLGKYCTKHISAEANFHLRDIIVIAPTILRSQLKQLFAQKSPQRRKFDRVYLGRIVYQGCCSKTRLPTVPNILAQACLYVP